MFPVTDVSKRDNHGSQESLYHMIASLLGRVEFRTADVMPLTQPAKLIFVHPWIYDLIDLHEFMPHSFNRQGDTHTQALQLITKLGRPFSILLLQYSVNRQYKHITTKYNIIISGVSYNPHLTKSISAEVLEVI